MRLLGNLLWLALCGLVLGVCWAAVGLLWCVTIVGIPVGAQCFKFAGFVLWPFGREIDTSTRTGATLLNLLWIFFGGAELAVVSAAIGAVLCITLIGIPFGKQCFKFALLAMLPFGARIVPAR